METFCPNCHKPNTPGAQFCRHCATPLPATGGQQQQQPPPQPPPFAPPNPGQFVNNQQWNQQQWNQGGAMQGGMRGGGFMQPPQAGASGRAIASLVLAICGLVLCCGPLTGVPAAVLGWLEISAIREGRSSPRGMTMAQIGLWGGIAVSVIMGILNVLMLIPMLLGGGRF